MSDERQMFQLPMGDLWRPPVLDEQGNTVERADSVKAPLPGERPKHTPEVAAILMRELEAGRQVPVSGQS